MQSSAAAADSRSQQASFGWPETQASAGAGFLGQLGLAPFRARRLVMRVMAAQVISVSECWMSRS
jgi:hypothetical protein